MAKEAVKVCFIILILFVYFMLGVSKKSSLVTSALLAKSCTRDTDSLHSYIRLTPRARMACL